MKRIIPVIMIFVILSALLFVNASAWDLKCDSCTNGKCPDCGGDGKSSCTAPCNGTGKLDCIVCIDGKVECTNCNEETRQDCVICGGFGEYNCDSCQGIGTTDCGECEDGTVDCLKCVITAGPDMLGKCTVCGGDGRVKGGDGEPTAADFETYGDRILDYQAPNNNQNQGAGTNTPPAGNTGNTGNNATNNGGNTNNTQTEKNNKLFEEMKDHKDDQWAVEFIKTSNDNTEKIEVAVIISAENSEAVKKLTNDEIEDKKDELETLMKTVSFTAKGEVSERFKSLAGEEPKFAVNFDGHCKVGFDVAVSILLKDVTLVGDGLIAYHYNEETETFEKIELVSCEAGEAGTELVFATDEFSDFVFSTVDISENKDEPETQAPSTDEKPAAKSGLSKTMQYIILLVTVIAAAAVITIISIKVIK